jgi:hypothetical protein
MRGTVRNSAATGIEHYLQKDDIRFHSNALWESAVEVNY